MMRGEPSSLQLDIGEQAVEHGLQPRVEIALDAPT